ncbi:hypothetical protein GUY44_12200 [Pimelobacter simplex]|uniref:TIR domain-containing protein n=1 Tax=Nocardioides simplex TaxID=2045 RepID=UPI0005362073|nr:TIR domain-containing protein [Pimelobacter simplex]MCG8151245.1 hypothetical protein [Pimelobacter simplex]GEB12202.1 hypothetical protein NSI01_05170 [Pimelobacter simplex]SFN16745.1 MTH538 TIR-like domain [Pimelobacter simplex]
MTRKVFFSFHYARDSWRVAKVRNSGVVSGYTKNPFYDKADWEKVRLRGPDGVRRWIDDQLAGTSVTVVLVGAKTSSRPWVKYEIEQSIAKGNGLLAIDISKIGDRNGDTDNTGINPVPTDYPLYRWNKDCGQKNLGSWIEAAAKAAGR